MGSDAPDRAITLPCPPSTNALWVHPGAGYGGRRKGRVRSDAYRKWLVEAGWQVRRQMVGAVMLRCTFDAEIRIPVASRLDRNNHDKAIFDALQTFGVVLNDSGLRDYTVRGEDRTDCLVMLWDRGGPEQRQASRPKVPGNVRPARAKASTVARWRAAGVLL